MAPFEREMVVSYKLSIVTIALSLTILPQFAIAIECHSPTLKSTGGGSLEPKFRGVPLGVDPLLFGSAESERPRLTNREIVSEEFQPM